MAGRRRILAGSGLVLAASLGAGLALGGAAAPRRSRQERRPSARSRPPRARGRHLDPERCRPLSINDIYRRPRPASSRSPRRRSSTSPPTRSSEIPSFRNSRAPAVARLGIRVDKAGHIVTNFHVVDGAKQVQRQLLERHEPEGNRRRHRPIERPRRAQDRRLVARADAAPLGRLRPDQVGDPVVAIGNPFGLDRTVTAGIVSAIQRAITAPNGYTIDHVIQTDASINHGNSGGPLLNSSGEVIGVTSQIETGDSSERGRQRRRRIRRPVQHGEDGDRAADPPGSHRPGIHRDQRRADHRATSPACSGCRCRRGWSSRASQPG